MQTKKPYYTFASLAASFAALFLYSSYTLATEWLCPALAHPAECNIFIITATHCEKLCFVDWQYHGWAGCVDASEEGGTGWCINDPGYSVDVELKVGTTTQGFWQGDFYSNDAAMHCIFGTCCGSYGQPQVGLFTGYFSATFDFYGECGG
jgi:hypothetical protein